MSIVARTLSIVWQCQLYAGNAGVTGPTWADYTPEVCARLEAAYQDGEVLVHFVGPDWDYVVNVIDRYQMNMRNGVRRTVRRVTAED
jgi:hypothetical protein